MKLLNSVLIMTATLVGMNAHAGQLNDSTSLMLTEQVASMNEQLKLQVTQDIKLATLTVKMPMADKSKTLIAKSDTQKVKHAESE